MFPLNYLYIAAAIAVAGMLGTIGYQSNKISGLEAEAAVYTSKNIELVKKIEDQNAALKAGEASYIEVQRNFDIATGKNVALTAEYAKLRNSWKVAPVPKDCPSSVIELQVRSSEISTKWNEKK